MRRNTLLLLRPTRAGAFAEDDIQAPMQAILHTPVAAHRMREAFGAGGEEWMKTRRSTLWRSSLQHARSSRPMLRNHVQRPVSDTAPNASVPR